MCTREKLKNAAQKTFAAWEKLVLELYQLDLNKEADRTTYHEMKDKVIERFKERLGLDGTGSGKQA